MSDRLSASVNRPTRWVPRYRAEVDGGELRRVLDLEPAIALALARRGLGDPAEAERFLNPSLADLIAPQRLPDMGPAVARVLQALRDRETILIHGDYDVDGLAATALLARSLRLLGGEVRTHIPDRLGEGYGLGDAVAEVAAQAGAGLVVSCDCGVRSVGPAIALRERGIDLVITDHHEPGHELPAACAVVNPMRADSDYPFRPLAGVGVAFKLGQAISEALGHGAARFQRAYLDLAALGTIADVVPLLGENRVLAAVGLERLRDTRKVGLRALARRARIEGIPVTEYHVGFVLAPRLNAAGRLEDADQALEILLTDDRQRAEWIAGRLEGLNARRQDVEARIVADAIARLEMEGSGLGRDPVVVLSDPNWHRGVAGLVAGQVRERFGRPTFVLCTADGVASGSARSVDGFHLAEAIDAVGDVLLSGGGHAMAAGVSLPAERVDEFRRRLNDYARERGITADDLVPTRDYEGELEAGEITHRLAGQIERLAPFGPGNPRPTFVTRGLRVEYSYPFGREDRHARIGLAAGGRVLVGLAFRRGDRLREVPPGMVVDVLHTIQTTLRSGVVELELVLQDFRASDLSGLGGG